MGAGDRTKTVGTHRLGKPHDKAHRHRDAIPARPIKQALLVWGEIDLQCVRPLSCPGCVHDGEPLLNSALPLVGCRLSSATSRVSLPAPLDHSTRVDLTDRLRYGDSGGSTMSGLSTLSGESGLSLLSGRSGESGESGLSTLSGESVDSGLPMLPGDSGVSNGDARDSSASTAKSRGPSNRSAVGTLVTSLTATISSRSSSAVSGPVVPAAAVEAHPSTLVDYGTCLSERTPMPSTVPRRSTIAPTLVAISGAKASSNRA
jgi:hypothetical protein